MDTTMVTGPWKLGWVLDHHTVSSTFLGYDDAGVPQYDTTRTALGQQVYDLKYRGRAELAGAIGERIADHIARMDLAAHIELVIPVPPSNLARRAQPVPAIARETAKRLGVPWSGDAVTRRRPSTELKNVVDFRQRADLLDGAFQVRGDRVAGKGILLVDDLYRSGATASEVARALYRDGRAGAVYFVAVTRTRSNR